MSPSLGVIGWWSLAHEASLLTGESGSLEATPKGLVQEGGEIFGKKKNIIIEVW
jgi:hypothetical protein